MIARARVYETLFRRTAKGREAMAPPGEGGDHVHYQPTQKVGIGVVTSKKRHEWSFFQVLAFELAGSGDPAKATVPFCTVAQAQHLWQQGLLK